MIAGRTPLVSGKHDLPALNRLHNSQPFHLSVIFPDNHCHTQLMSAGHVCIGVSQEEPHLCLLFLLSISLFDSSSTQCRKCFCFLDGVLIDCLSCTYLSQDSKSGGYMDINHCGLCSASIIHVRFICDHMLYLICLHTYSNIQLI